MSSVGLLLLCGIFLGVGPVGVPMAHAAGDAVTIDATVDGTPVGEDELLLDPSGSSRISMTVHNGTDTVRHVKAIRLSGTALALTFFSYDTTVPFDVPAKQSVTRGFVLDLGQLGTQATGLLPTELEVLDTNREVIASIGTTGDVRGSVWSVYGVFGLAVFGLTVLAWAGALFALARRRLPANRWQRAMRFLPAGVGTGLVAVISLSVLRVMAPSPAAEIPFILGAAAVALVLGYLTPHPAADELPPLDPPLSPPPPLSSPLSPPPLSPPFADPEATQRITRPLPGGAA
ncbi:hypothetical protein [Saccharothrix deserti]|uniref:hypothetical protein n=1 Tax=Saccharothrix deserti TaxID=2593674 RepID=UPI00131A9707|nr:hypothetical protein [Saccharothrix deserti]